MSLSSQVEIVRELEDKIPCPSCGSCWMDPVILGKEDWLIPAIGLEPRAPGPLVGPTEQVQCHGCGAEPEIDVLAIVRALSELHGVDRAVLAELIAFKRQLVGAMVRGQSVLTPFGLFFGRAWSARLERAEDIDGFVRITARRVPQFLPSETFIHDVSDRALPAATIRAAMERTEAGGFWDVDRQVFSEIATGVQIPQPDWRLDAPGLYDDVVADLRASRASALRGLGAWVLRRVGDPASPRDLLDFSFWRGLTHVVDRAQSPSSGRRRREQPEVVYVFFDHARSAQDPRSLGGGLHRSASPSLQKSGEATSS
jgi:nucleoid DNA-binding protein